MRRPLRRRFASLQVEVTTDCFLRCPFCPNRALSGSWRKLYLPLPLYERLACAFPLARHVHLQGWGEPLLHPELPRMVELAKAAGCAVGTTSNGVLLREETAERLLQSGLDLLVISIAGARAETHDRLRLGSRLAEIVANLEALAERKRRLGTPLPKVVLSFLMHGQNPGELPAAVELAARVGAAELVATNLDCVVDEAGETGRAFVGAGLASPWEEALAEAGERARRHGILFRPYPLAEQEGVLVCEALAEEMPVVAADGGVFPCTYLNLPVDTIPRLHKGERLALPRRPFGNLAEADLLAIWDGAQARAFREAFKRRQRTHERLAVGAQLLGTGEVDLAEVERRAPLPETCRGCYKTRGV